MKNLIDCHKCKLRAGCSRPVPGNGPLADAKIMLVGEAPGAEEDFIGEPFVGGAGRLLNAILFGIGLPRSRVYVTNVVKCRPPGNRVPEEEEIEACREHLLNEIRLVRPNKVVALGNTAALALTGHDISWAGMDAPIFESLADGKLLNVLICYHPAYLLRNRALIPILSHDLSKLKNPVYKIASTYTPIATPVEFLALAKSANDYLAIDIETGGGKEEALDPWRGKLLGVGICPRPGQAASMQLNSQDAVRALEQALRLPVKKVFQNGAFDLAFLKLAGYDIVNYYWDTMVAAHTSYSSAPADLDFLRARYTSIPPYKTIYKGGKKRGVEHMDAYKLGEYNCLDTDVTYRSALAQMETADSRTMTLILEGVKLTEIAVGMRIRGICVDTKALGRLARSLLPEVAQRKAEFTTKFGVNPASNKQLSKLLFEEMQCPIPARAHKGKTAHVSVDEEILESLRNKKLPARTRECVDLLLAYRDTSQETATFVVGVATRLKHNPTGGFSIHPEWKPTGADTGRWSCKNPNVQNPPKQFRNIYIAKPGHIFYIGDYSQLEFRVALAMAKDTETLARLDGGWDIHEETRRSMEVVYPGATRLMAKATVFGSLYGLSPTTLARNLAVTRRVAEDLQQICLYKFPKLLDLRNQFANEFKQSRTATSFYGRRKFCDRETQALNHPVQSTAIEIVNKAMLSICAKYGNFFVLQVHDELVVQIPREMQPQFTLQAFQEEMEHAGYALHPTFPVVVKIATCWAEPQLTSPPS